MGYGFVEFKKAAAAKEALKTLQKHKLDDHQLELKISLRETLWVACYSAYGCVLFFCRCPCCFLSFCFSVFWMLYFSCVVPGIPIPPHPTSPFQKNNDDNNNNKHHPPKQQAEARKLQNNDRSPAQCVIDEKGRSVFMFLKGGGGGESRY